MTGELQDIGERTATGELASLQRGGGAPRWCSIALGAQPPIDQHGRSRPGIFQPIYPAIMNVARTRSEQRSPLHHGTHRQRWPPPSMDNEKRRTSPHGLRMQQFVIERFTPSCHVDIAVSGELVTPASSDAVDSILGNTAGENVQDRTAMSSGSRSGDLRRWRA